MTAVLERRVAAQEVSGLLAASAVAMVLTHWLRLLPLPDAGTAGIRYEDLVDLVTPFVVAGPALVVLARLGARQRVWALALGGSVLFVQGHGLHLSANSITWVSGPAAPAYLWDEQVGHDLWFVGLTALVVAVVHVVHAQPLRAGWGATSLAVLVGLTWAANVVEAGAVPLGVVLALLLVALGRRHAGTAVGRLLVLAYGLSLLLVAAWGLRFGGFPQPSELGWL